MQVIKYLGKGSFWGHGQRVLQIIRLNTMVDIIRVAKARTSCEYLPIDTNFPSILLIVSVPFSRTFSPHSKAKVNYKSTNLRKIGN